MTTHHKFSPSSYPAWMACPHYQGGDAGADALVGTEAHALLYRAFTGDINIHDDLATADIGSDILFSVRKAYDGISALINEVFQGKESIRHFEHRVECAEALIAEAPYGTADVIAQCGDTVLVIDYKHHFSDRPHLHQLAAYAAFYQCAHPEVTDATLAVWYGDSASYDISHHSIEECRTMAVEAVEARKHRIGKECKGNPYCSICKHCGMCKASVKLVDDALAVVPSIDSNAVVKPEMMIPLVVAWSDLKKRMEKALEYIKEYAIQNGGALFDSDGNKVYEITESSRSDIDILALFAEVSDIMTPAEFLEACSLTKKSAQSALRAKGMKLKDTNALISRCSIPLPPTIKLERVK